MFRFTIRDLLWLTTLGIDRVGQTVWAIFSVGILLCPLSESGRANEGPRRLDALIAQLSSDDRAVQNKALSELQYADEAAIRSLPALVRIVNSSGQEQRCRALDILGQMGPAAKAASSTVAARLHDDSALMQLTAASALLRIEKRNAAAITTLAELVCQGELETRVAAAQALGELGGQVRDAAPALVAATESPQPTLRAAAAQALGQVDPEELDAAVSALRKLLTDSDRVVRITAAEALWNLDESAEAIPTLVAALAEFRPANGSVFSRLTGGDRAIEIIETIGPEAKAAVPELFTILGGEHLGQRLRAADALAAIRSDAHAAIDSLAKALRDTEVHSAPLVHRTWCVSDRAAIALRNIGPRSRPVLLAALRDKDDRVRWNASGALGHLPPDQDTIDGLVKLLDDEDESVRASAAFALGRIGPPAEAAAPALAARLNDEGKWTSYPGGGIGSSFTVGDHLLIALEKINAQPADIVPPMIRAIEKSKKLQPAMLRMLRQLGPRAKTATAKIEPLLAQPDQKLAAAAALTRIDPDQDGLLEILRAGLAGDDFDSIRVAVTGLGDLGARARSALGDLSKHFDRENECGQAIVAAAMLRIDSQQPEIIVKLATALRDCPDGDAEAAALWATLGKNSQQAQEVLVFGLTYQDQDPAADWFWTPRQDAEHRLISAKLLIDAEVRSPNVIEALAALCQSVDCGARGDAADQLARLGPASEAAVPALVKLLPDQELYLVGGDFYGNGGTRNFPGEHAAQALVKIGGAAIPQLRQALKSDAPLTRQRAAESLGAIGAAAQPANSDLMGRLKDRYPAVRAAAATALGKISKDDTTVDALIAALKDKRLAVRIAAAEALGTIGPTASRSVPALEKLQNDGYEDTRTTSKKSTSKIRGE